MIDKIFDWCGEVFGILGDFVIPLRIGDSSFNVSYLSLIVAGLAVLFFVNLFWKGARA